MVALPTVFPFSQQAMLFYGPRNIRLEAIEQAPPQAGEVVVAIGAALTCGTDLKCYRRGHPVLLGDYSAEHPARFGHEGAGTVVAVGPGVTHLAVGDRVAWANSAPCGQCFFCQKQQPNLCQQLHLLNGTYAQTLTLPAPIVSINTYKLPPHLPFEVAAFMEPLAVSLRGIVGVGVQAGDTVAIMGLGAIGQLMVRIATHLGACVTALGRSPHKLAMAQTFGGAQQVVTMSEGLSAKAIADIKTQHTPQGLGFDWVIEAVGLPETWQAAVSLARRGGQVHWFAGCAGGSTVAVDTRRVHYDEIRLHSLFHHTPAMVAMAFEWLASGQLDPTPLISGRYPLAQLPQAFTAMEAGEGVEKGFKYAILPPPLSYPLPPTGTVVPNLCP